MHKISEDFGTTESVKFVTFARLLRSLVWINVASSLEVLFLHPGVVSLTDEDAQGVPQVVELGDLPKEVTDKSIRPNQEFEGQNKSIKSRIRSTLMIWDTFVVDKADVVSFMEAYDVEDVYSRAMSSKNKAKGKDREKA
ncbi:hypothetical protein ACFX2G_008623 [Malus domestica]